MSDPDLRPGVLFDVDGTLLDTNYLHVFTWWKALQEAGYDDVSMTQIHGAVGIGSAQLVSHLTGEENKEVVERHSQLYAPYQDQVRAFPHAADLLAGCRDAGLTVVLATSGAKSDLDWMLPVIGTHNVLQGAITSGDVEASKPAPDLLTKALDEHRLDPARTAVVGDTVWDVEAAERAGLPCVALLSGGIAEEHLRSAGAVEIYQDPADLLARLQSSLLAELA
ncbi:HAD family hydrolase [Allobranchiibius sp. CTAmp26]|uniref:HAD family hydrolase n=1 Tax=Allobranchiibius sp. CTAmp26 TaxID=2815214 RepID=UPI001AA1C24F|nr:HAD family hydrolase [Allobranchiibius sp. CTAmp26]MBO1756488.1 HAD family hydrolase [Allobranchiibius sp. CTAmp26]